MNFIDNLKYFNKNSEKRKYIQKIIDKLPENKDICKEILKKIDNDKTKCKLDNDLKNCYYVYLNDTIYITNREKARKIYTRVLLIAHECRHSIQSKIIQNINFVFSNIELLLFFMFMILVIFVKINKVFFIFYGLFVFISVLPRLFLEIDAVINSVKIANMYMLDKLEEKDVKIITNVFDFQTKLLFPVLIISLYIDKIIRAGIILIMYRYIYT